MESFGGIIFAAAGASCGFFCISLAERIVVYKCKKKGREVPLYYWGNEERYICILLAAVLFMMAEYYYPLVQAVLLCLFTIISIIGTLIDYRIRIIPNELVLSIFVLGVFFNLLEGGLKHICLSVAASVITFILFFLAGKITYYFIKNFGVGAGDVKFASVAAFAIGIERLNLFYSGIVIALSVYLMAGFYFKRLKIGCTFPMGGQLMAGFIAAFLLPVIL